MPQVRDRVPSDGELIERIAGGDRAAFEELYQRYARAVLGLALRRLGDRGRAEDASQEAFVAIWCSARTYDSALALPRRQGRDHRRPAPDARARGRARGRAGPRARSR